MATNGLDSLDQLQQRSTADIGWFWEAVLRDLGIRFRRPYTRIVDLAQGPAWPEWCVGGFLNIVDNCLDRNAGTATDAKPPISWEDEEGRRGRVSYAELRRDVNRIANALRALGLRKGDAIGVFMPMTPEIVVAMLAIIKIGGVFLPLFSGFGSQALIARLADAEAKALFTADAGLRHGKVAPMKPIADEAVAQLPALRKVIVFRRTGMDVAWQAGRDHWWHELLAQGRDESETEQTRAEDPLMLIYTSGTTGRPKGAVHTHCGFPIKAAQDMSQGMDLHADEPFVGSPTWAG